MNKHLKPVRTAKLFKDGRSQVVRLPAEFRFEGDEVEIWRDEQTGAVILSEKRKQGHGWDEFFRLRDALLASGEMPEDFMRDREQGATQRDDFLDDL